MESILPLFFFNHFQRELIYLLKLRYIKISFQNRYYFYDSILLKSIKSSEATHFLSLFLIFSTNLSLIFPLPIFLTFFHLLFILNKWSINGQCYYPTLRGRKLVKMENICRLHNKYDIHLSKKILCIFNLLLKLLYLVFKY